MTVEELLRRISARELTEWMAYFELEPSGMPQFADAQAEYRAALITSMIANTHRDAKKRKPFEPTEFMRPQYLGPKPEAPTQEELDRRIMMIFGMMGGRNEPQNPTGAGG